METSEPVTVPINYIPIPISVSIEVLIILHGERNHSMGSSMVGTPSQSEDR